MFNSTKMHVKPKCEQSIKPLKFVFDLQIKCQRLFSFQLQLEWPWTRLSAKLINPINVGIVLALSEYGLPYCGNIQIIQTILEYSVLSTATNGSIKNALFSIEFFLSHLIGSSFD